MASTGRRRRAVLKRWLTLAAGIAGLGSLATPSFEKVTTPCTDGPPRARSAGDAGPDPVLAVVDRVVDDRFVVLLLESDGDPPYQIVVPHAALPVEERDVLAVTVEGGELRDAWALREETDRRRRRTAWRRDCLGGRSDR